MPSDPVAGRVRGMVVGQGSYKQKKTVRHTKYGRIRGMIAGEGGRSTGVLLYRVQCTVESQFTVNSLVWSPHH